jgi:(R)-amidase
VAARSAITCLLVQGDCLPGRDDVNGERAAELVCAHPDAALALFPELFLSGYEDGLRRGPDESTELGIAALADAARAAGTAVIAGVPGRVAAGRTSAAVCIDERGETLTTVHKALPFGAEREMIVGVDEPGLVELAGERVGVMICFDMEFPETARRLAFGGATVLVSVSANPRPYYENHRLHARARALENRLPHLYVNRAGREGELIFTGGTRVVDCDGEVTAELGRDDEDVLLAELPARPPRDDDPLDYVSIAAGR